MAFGDFAESIAKRAEPKDAQEEIYVGLEHLDPQCLHIRRWGKGSDVIGGKLRFRKGDIIFGKRRAYQRKLAVAEFGGICSAHAMVIRARPDKVLPEFLPFLMMSDRFMNRAVEISVGSLSPTINWTTLKLETFDLPPLDQQRRIAEILWAVDEAEQAFAGLVESLGVTRTAKFDGLIPSPGESSQTVNFVRLDKVASMQNGRPFPSSEYQDPSTPGVRLIRPGNLAPDGRVGWAPKATVTLPERHRSENEGWFVGADQVLINLTAQSLDDGFMGRVCFTGENDGGMLNQRIGRFVLEEKILPKFFFRCLQTSRFRQLVENRCEGSKVRHLYFRHFEDFMLPDYPKPKQAKIAQELDECESALSSAIKQQEALSGLRGTLINTILH
ncbi:MAG: restriction endonuclease subunit S [Verrucomicrobiales bacterium]